MHRFFPKAILAASAFLALSIPGACHAGLIGSDFTTGNIYDVDLATGLATNARQTGLAQLDGIAARQSNGLLYGLTNSGSLYRINPTTGASTLVGSTGLFFVEGDLAFNPLNGNLYGIQANAPNSPYGIVMINPDTAATTIVGTLSGVSDLSAGAFGRDGTFYLIDTGTGGQGSVSTLLTINPATAAILSRTTLSVALGPTAGLAFDPSTGVAYVADGSGIGGTSTRSLYTLNTSTGTLTTVGPTGAGSGLSGLAFAPNSVPEPASLAMVALGLGAVGLAARRRRPGRSA